MGIASGMKDLVQDIASAHEDRAQKIDEIEREAGRLRGEAGDMIKDFRSSRRKTGVQQRKDLVQGTARRKAGVETMLRETQGLVEGFHALRKEEGARMRQGLAQGVAELKSEVEGIVKDAQQTIKSFHSCHQEMAAELRRELAESRLPTKSEVEGLLRQTQAQVKDMARSRQRAGAQLKRGLAQGRADRESGVKDMLGGFGKTRAGVIADLKEAAAVWQGLGAQGTRPKRARATAPVEQEDHGLEAKLMETIKSKPDGITLTEVAESLGVAHIVLGKASGRLLEKGEIRKAGKLYFAVLPG